MNSTLKGAQRILASLTMMATVLGMASFAALTPATALAVAPADYGLHEGDVIRATGDIDIYIVNALGYKRLFVNPAIFNLYGHLSWANVKEVAPSTRDAFVTSGLFRNCETGDQKVYGLDVISEDVANLRWVNTTGAQAVADDPAFFNKVFCINTAEQHLYGTGADYTSVLQVPNYARGNTTSGSFGVTVAADNPASSTIVEGQARADLAHFAVSGSGVVHQLSLKRLGISSDSVLNNVYLFVNGARVTDGATFGSGMITFNDANGLFTAPAVVSVRGDVATSTSGQTVGVQVTSVENAAVSASGNLMSIATAPSGLSAVALSVLSDAGSGIDPQSDVRVWQVNANVTGHDVMFNRLTLRMIGSVAYTDINNFRLYVDGIQVAAAAGLDSNGYVTFLPNRTVAVGSARVIKVLADVVGGATRTFSFQLKGNYDMDVVDSNINIGVNATGSGVLGTATTTCTVSASPHVDVTKAVDSPSGDIVQGSNAVTLANFKFKAYGEAIKVDQIGAKAVVNSGTPKLRNGHILIDGVQYGSTKDLDTSATVSYTINYTFQPGVEHTVSVVADLYDSVGAANIASGLTASALIDSVSGQLAQGVTSGQTVSGGVPSASVAGNTFNIVAGSLSLNKDSAYANQNIVPPQSNFLLGQWNLTGPSTEGVNVNTLSFTPTFTGTTFDQTDLTNLYVVYGSQTAPAKATVNAGSNDFSVNNLVVGPSQVVPVKLYANVGSGVTATSGVSFKLTANGVTQLSGATANAGPSTGQTISYAVGSFTYTRDGSSPNAAIVAGNQQATAAAFKFTATNDSFSIKKLVFTMLNATGINGVDLMDGSTVVASLPASLSMTFNIPTGSQPVVAAGATKVLSVRLNLGIIGTPGGGASAADHTVTLASGTALQGSSGVENAITAGTNTAGNTLIAYKAIPTITLQSLPSTTLGAGTKTIAKFTISTTAGNVSWKAFAMDVASSSAVTGITSAKVYDSSHSLVAGNFYTTASVSLSSALHGRVVFVATNEQEISGSQTYTVEALIAVSTLTAGSNLSTTLPSVASGKTATTFTGGLAADMTQWSLAWSDESVTSPAHGLTTSDWHNDYLVQNLPTSSQTLSY